MTIVYTFHLDDGRQFRFVVDLDRSPAQGSPESPEWTRLAFHQCTLCPLSLTNHSHCPAALDLQAVVDAFKSIISFENVTIEVKTPERTISKKCDAQMGIRSLAGLVMATSACPILSQLKGLARQHLPFATMKETVARTVGAYLLGQFFQYKQGLKPDMDLRGLDKLYQDLHAVDCCFKKRIDAASDMDATMNAIGSLAFLAMGVTFSVEEMLADFETMAIPTKPV